MRTSHTHSFSTILHYGWILIAAFLLVQPFGHLFELPIALMACLGLALLFTQWPVLKKMHVLKLLLLMFGCIWIPMLISLTSAVNLSRSLQTALVFLRFPLAALFIFIALRNSLSRNRLFYLIGLALSLAIAFVFILKICGHTENGRLLPPFPIGHVMGVLSPLYFYWAWKFGRRAKWLLIPLYVVAVLFSGSRVAWIMLAVGMILFIFQLFLLENMRWRWQTTLLLVLALTVGVGVASKDEGLRYKLSQSAGIFSGNYKKINFATSARLPIWRVAVLMIKDHWVTGVGPRGFRYLYVKYAEPDDPEISKDRTQGSTHPHQFVLEILVETGVIGLTTYLIAFFFWIRLMYLAVREKQAQIFPWMSAVLIAIMPINAHMAFYASFWSCITWWLIANSLALWQFRGDPDA